MNSLMDEYSSQFRWKNFNLNMELHVAGDFIYEGIYLIDRISQLKYEDEYFQFLYNISVGIERLEKIAYLLVAHKSGEESPATKWKKHEHTKLYELINQHAKLEYAERELEFLKLLREFYIEGRYDRFNFSNNTEDTNKDKELLLSYLMKYLDVKPHVLFGTESILLTPELKESIGNVISNIVVPLYELIHETADLLRLFTYEIRYESKSYKIFVEQDFSFSKENTAKRELIINLINNTWQYDEFIDRIKSIEPLEIEQQSADKYISYLINSTRHTEVKDEITQIYEDEDNMLTRSNQIQFIGEDYFYKDDDLDDQPEV